MASLEQCCLWTPRFSVIIIIIIQRDSIHLLLMSCYNKLAITLHVTCLSLHIKSAPATQPPRT